MTKPRSLGLIGLENLRYPAVWQRNMKLHLSPGLRLSQVYALLVFSRKLVGALGFRGQQLRAVLCFRRSSIYFRIPCCKSCCMAPVVKNE